MILKTLLLILMRRQGGKSSATEAWSSTPQGEEDETNAVVAQKQL